MLGKMCDKNLNNHGRIHIMLLRIAFIMCKIMLSDFQI